MKNGSDAGDNARSDGDESRKGERSPHKSSSTNVKTFKCTFEGCTKVYTRAEHLQRHQLNHAPKEVYQCRIPGCNRTFVRQDLYYRHRERHMHTNGNQAQDVPSVETAEGTATPAKKRRVGRPSLADMHHRSNSATEEPPEPRSATSISPTGLVEPRSSDGNIGGDSLRYDTTFKSNEVGNSTITLDTAQDPARPQQLQSIQPGNWNNFAATSNTPQLAQPNTGNLQSSSKRDYFRHYSSDGLPPQQNNSSNFNIASGTGFPAQSYNRTSSYGGDSVVGNFQQAASHSLNFAHNLPANFQHTPGDSPHSVRDDFTAWLFDDASNMYSNFGQFNASLDSIDPYYLNNPNMVGQPYDPLWDNSLLASAQDALSVGRNSTSSPTMSSSDSSFSPLRRLELIEHMRAHFGQNLGRNAQPDQAEIFDGDIELDDHVLSSRMMQQYIYVYWHYFHEQLPILHRPTFSTDSSPTLLVLAVIVIGASLLPQKSFTTEITDRAHRLASFIAWHLRWHIFMDSDFQPPAKLWVFQTLVLLEVYEKMNATRALHERAHIHYGTTINLMRRGTALIDDMQSGASAQQRLSPHEYWERWIVAEATRRVAFAAFLLDALHANMFGHTAVMVVHEIHLPLPCDEALWSATSPAEVGRIEASFHLNGIKPVTFVNALKRTLTGRKVRTNAFGRSIIMGGLQSISWHLRQRELQMNTLGVPQANAVPDSWRFTLTKAFDAWKKDLDEDAAYIKNFPFAFGLQASGAQFDARMGADMATVFHHLSHITIQINPVEFQILTGAPKLLGRAITAADRYRVQKKLSAWTGTSGAALATDHALQLLRKYLEPSSNARERSPYNARDDSLLIRPWALYLAGLTVWCYAYAAHSFPRQTQLSAPASPVDGDRSRAATPTTLTVTSGDRNAAEAEAASMAPAHINLDMEQVSGYLQKVGNAFSTSRWELLREAEQRLRQADEMLRQIGSRE